MMPTCGLNEHVVVHMKSPIRLGVRANKKARNVLGKMVKYLQSLLLAAWLPPFSEIIRPCLKELHKVAYVIKPRLYYMSLYK